MNDIYHCIAEVMVNLEMEELKREVDSIRLIREAGLSNPSLLERTVIAIGNTLVRLGERVRKNYTDPHQAYQITSGKLAS
jgi:hypothetical protein